MTGQDSGDYGLYRCIATNVVGSDQHDITVTQIKAIVSESKIKTIITKIKIKTIINMISNID